MYENRRLPELVSESVYNGERGKSPGDFYPTITKLFKREMKREPQGSQSLPNPPSTTTLARLLTTESTLCTTHSDLS